jgi:hypothetical protein
MEHLDGEAVLAAPDFEDPLAHFVICTDASDYAVGGVLMQWQHDDWRGPGPPPGTVVGNPGVTNEGKEVDPLDSKWRAAAGWKLKVICYYSKTLDDSQKNYPAFDKEAGAALLCCRQWADLITYHPTTLYTDSSVATSMLTKHMAPTRLQRWGAELAAFLPHLRISYRKGCDNGLADLLSRYPAFRKYAATRSETVTLPDDYFDYIGDAPLYHRIPSSRDRTHLQHSYELYEPKDRPALEDSFWTFTNAPEIDDRGPPRIRPKSLESLAMHSISSVADSRYGAQLHELLAHLRSEVVAAAERTDPVGAQLDNISIFRATINSPPTFRVSVSDLSTAAEIGAHIRAIGGDLATQPDGPADVVICDGDDTPL